MDMKKRYAGVISFVVGVLGALYGWGTISSDKDSYSIWGSEQRKFQYYIKRGIRLYRIPLFMFVKKLF